MVNNNTNDYDGLWCINERRRLITN